MALRFPVRQMLASAGFLLALQASAADFPRRYWPAFPRPDRIVASVSHNSLNSADGVLLHTVAGLVAYDTRARNSGELVWIGLTGATSYDEWLERCLARLDVPREPGELGVWDLVDRYRDRGIIRGYILYAQERGERPLYALAAADESVNVATALCPLLYAVALDESLEAQAREHGLERVLDVRGKDERWLWDTYGSRFTTSLLARQDPKSFVVRSEIAAYRAMVVSDTGPLYEDALARLHPGSPILGWGLGLEDAQTRPSSQYACIQTATNWCVNLPVLSAGETGLDYRFQPFVPPADAQADPGAADTRYVTFVLSDGDNVQWLMLNFCKGEEARQYWACPERGRLPFGWTIPAMDLLQVCPYTLDYLRDTASPRDDVVLLSGGYYYPDEFGQRRTETDLLARHARRLGAYMGACGITSLLVNLQDWDGETAQRAYETYAREIPALKGIFAIQYAPYTAGAGAIRWVDLPGQRRLPVISARNAIWAGRGDDPREGTPSRVAAMLNAWAAQPVERDEDRFAWVIVHCWSWFRPGQTPAAEEVDQAAPGSGDVARGYRPALWCSAGLAPNIRVVTPTALLNRLTRQP
jgi:hypothetical protein